MEKNTPHCKLAVVKALIRAGRVHATESALAGAAALGLDFDDIVHVVDNLKPADFYKSMTTYRDHKQWQDVYRPRTEVGELYLKLTIFDHVLVVSFKESTP
jgi:motility quorum-sensing regulator / GCU-specific mRNA interferase toxin